VKLPLQYFYGLSKFLDGSESIEIRTSDTVFIYLPASLILPFNYVFLHLNFYDIQITATIKMVYFLIFNKAMDGFVCLAKIGQYLSLKIFAHSVQLFLILR